MATFPPLFRSVPLLKNPSHDTRILLYLSANVFFFSSRNFIPSPHPPPITPILQKLPPPHIILTHSTHPHPTQSPLHRKNSPHNSADLPLHHCSDPHAHALPHSHSHSHADSDFQEHVARVVRGRWRESGRGRGREPGMKRGTFGNHRGRGRAPAPARLHTHTHTHLPPPLHPPTHAPNPHSQPILHVRLPLFPIPPAAIVLHPSHNRVLGPAPSGGKSPPRAYPIHPIRPRAHPPIVTTHHDGGDVLEFERFGVYSGGQCNAARVGSCIRAVRGWVDAGAVGWRHGRGGGLRREGSRLCRCCGGGRSRGWGGRGLYPFWFAVRGCSRLMNIWSVDRLTMD